MKNVNIANIRTDNILDLLGKWVALTQPLHHLTEAEGAIFLEFLKKRHLFYTNVKDSHVADLLLFSTETRREIMQKLGYKMGTFQNYLSSMRAKGVIFENKINPKLVPNIEADAKEFKLIYNFTVKNNG
jgi:hypothetical protein